MANQVNTSPAGNKTANRRFYEEVINQKNLAILDEITAANYVNHSLPANLPTSRDGLKQFVKAFQIAFPDGTCTIDQMIAEGNTVATRLTFQGTHTGEFQGLAPTGKRVTVPALDMARYEESKIVEHWGGPDQMSLMQQLGVLSSRG
jgi:predicted ester cyclase